MKPQQKRTIKKLIDNIKLELNTLENYIIEVE